MAETQYEHIRRQRVEAQARMHMYQSMLIEFSRIRDAELRRLCDLCKKGICSAHQPSSGVIEAMRKRRQADMGGEITVPSPEDQTVTRFEVIDHRKGDRGRVFIAWPVRIELSYQDNGRTLKVFVTDAGDQTATWATGQAVTWSEAYKIATDALLDMEARRLALAEREAADASNKSEDCPKCHSTDTWIQYCNRCIYAGRGEREHFHYGCRRCQYKGRRPVHT